MVQLFQQLVLMNIPLCFFGSELKIINSLRHMVYIVIFKHVNEVIFYPNASIAYHLIYRHITVAMAEKSFAKI